MSPRKYETSCGNTPTGSTDWEVSGTISPDAKAEQNALSVSNMILSSISSQTAARRNGKQRGNKQTLCGSEDVAKTYRCQKEQY